jgi:triacylglycerol lipase
MVLALFAACQSDGDLGPAASGSTPDSTPSTHTGATTAPPACATLPTVEGDAALQGRPILHIDQSACVAGLHATAGARDSVLRIHVDADRDVVVSAVDPGGRTLLEDTVVLAHDPAGVTLIPARSGEVLVTIAPAEPLETPWTYDLGVSCDAGCELPFSRYPVLLMHGLSGSDTVFGVDYFYRVTSTLEALGLEVSSPGVAAFSDSEARASEWSSYVDELLARGHRRVNLFGHSQGGIDARLLASPAGRNRGDVIASVTTLGTPHRGTPIADLVLLAFDGGLVDEALFDVGVSVFSAILGLQPDDPEFVPAMEQLAESTMAVQDVALTDHPATWYGSWLGRSCGILEPACQNRMDGEVVDVLMGASYLLVWPRQNDGLVPVDSQSHGVLLGEVPADHADEIGQISDDVPDPFDHLAFYRSEVDRLEALGF